MRQRDARTLVSHAPEQDDTSQGRAGGPRAAATRFLASGSSATTVA